MYKVIIAVFTSVLYFPVCFFFLFVVSFVTTKDTKYLCLKVI